MTQTAAQSPPPFDRPLSVWRWDAAAAVLLGGAAALLAAGMKGKLEGPGTFGWFALGAAFLCSRIATTLSDEKQRELARVTFGGYAVVAVFVALLMSVVFAVLGGLGGVVVALVGDREVWPTAWSGLSRGGAIGGVAGGLVLVLRALAVGVCRIAGDPRAPRVRVAVPRDVALLAAAAVVTGSAAAMLSALRFLDLSPFEAPDLVLPGPALLLAIAAVVRARQGRGPQRSVR